MLKTNKEIIIVFGAFLLFVISLILFALSYTYFEKQQSKIDNLIQTQGYSWITTQGVPDSVYFVSFGGDTIWYKRANWKCDAGGAYYQGMSDAIELCERDLRNKGTIPKNYEMYRGRKYRTIK